MRKKIRINRKRDSRLRILAAGFLAAGVVLLVGCQNSGGGSPSTTAAETEQTTEDVTAETEQTTEHVAETTKQMAESGAAQTEKSAEPKTLFGSFSSKTLLGEDVTEEIFSEAGLTMVNIWGTYCGPCVREMPDLAELSQEYGGEDFQMVGIVVDAADVENANAMEIVAQTGADYIHILISQELIDGYLGQVQAVPTTIFIDSEGNQVGKTYMGSKTKTQWEEIIKSLLE